MGVAGYAADASPLPGMTPKVASGAASLGASSLARERA
jgi:hypothetical protein